MDISQITKNGTIKEIRSLTDYLLSNQKYPVGAPKTTGTVCFGSDPSGANIYVDGIILTDIKTEETKRTPTCANLIEGRRDITFSLPPHADVNRYVDVMPGKSVSIYTRFK